MKKIHFKFKEHPGDLLRGTELLPLPDPHLETEDFLVQFLPHYQSDERIAYSDDLSKLLYNDFFDEIAKNNFIESIGGPKTDEELLFEIETIDEELINEAYKNFYKLIFEDKIEIVANGQEK